MFYGCDCAVQRYGVGLLPPALDNSYVLKAVGPAGLSSLSPGGPKEHRLTCGSEAAGSPGGAPVRHVSHVLRMQNMQSDSIVADGKRADQRRSRRRPSAFESPGCYGWTVTQRVPPHPDERPRADSNGAGACRADPGPRRAQRPVKRRRYHPVTRPALIVVDASALTDFLIGRPRALRA